MEGFLGNKESGKAKESRNKEESEPKKEERKRIRRKENIYKKLDEKDRTIRNLERELERYRRKRRLVEDDLSAMKNRMDYLERKEKRRKLEDEEKKKEEARTKKIREEVKTALEAEMQIRKCEVPEK